MIFIDVATPPWDVQVEVEDELLDLLAEARRMREYAHSDPTWCRTVVMDMMFVDHLKYLFGLDVDPDGWAGRAAYDVAYERIWNELPPCAACTDDCRARDDDESAD